MQSLSKFKAKMKWLKYLDVANLTSNPIPCKTHIKYQISCKGGHIFAFGIDIYPLIDIQRIPKVGSS